MDNGYIRISDSKCATCDKPSDFVAHFDSKSYCGNCYYKAESIAMRKELLSLALTLKQQNGMSMAMAHQLLKEKEVMYEYIMSAAECNAERASEAILYSGSTNYSYIRINDQSYRDRVREIDNVLYPSLVRKALEPIPPYIEITDEELPF